MGVRMRAWAWAWAWAWVVLVLVAPCTAFFMQRTQEEEEPGMRHVLEALNKMSQTLETHERHTSLYERVALLETSLSEKTARAMVLQAEVTQLRAKIPELEAEIKTIPEMRKELAEFKANIEKLVQDYEVKLSTLASEVIRLKKTGARRKDLLTLSDGSNVLLRPAQSCPEVGQSMVAERIGEHCLYFSNGDRQNWTSSHNQCRQLGAEMAASHVLQPLKQFLRHAFGARGPSLWLGSTFNLSDDENQEDEDQSEDEDASDIVVKVSGGDLGLTSGLNPRQDLSDIIQADGVIGFPGRRAEGRSNPFVLNLKEGPVEDVEEEMSGPAGSLRGVLDPVPMFHDDFLAGYGSHFLAEEPTEDAPTDEDESERVAGNSVVDIVLLKGPDADVRRQDIEAHDHSNQTQEGSREAAARLLHSGAAAPGEGGSVEEAGGSIQESGKAKDSRKTRMKCMLLQQSESLEYEVVGRPCDEQHSFVCDFKVTIDRLLPE